MLGTKSQMMCLRIRVLRNPQMILLVWMLAVASIGSAVDIKSLSIPRWIEDAKQESVVLDCEYDLGEEDMIALKWFFKPVNMNTFYSEPIYQWLPKVNKTSNKRTFSDRFESFIKQDNAVSPANDVTKYRAINLNQPTANLSGEYQCVVYTMSGEASKSGTMMVYVPPESFKFNYVKNTHSALFLCEAEGVFPVPDIQLLQKFSFSTEFKPVNEVERIIQKVKNETAYNVKVIKTILNQNLPKNRAVQFTCELKFQGSDFRKEQSLYYKAEPSKASAFMKCDFPSTILLLIAIALTWASS